MKLRFTTGFATLLVVALSISSLAACSKKAGAAGAQEGMLAVGSLMPNLSAVDQNGSSHNLADYRGKPIVVYFYPRDATPGCTKEACAFRDVWKRYSDARVQVFGVSSDNQASKAKFAKEHRLPFPILADPDKRWIEAFDVPTRLGMASRVTFLIDRDGRVAKVYRDVDPGVHATEVLNDALALKK